MFVKLDFLRSRLRGMASCRRVFPLFFLLVNLSSEAKRSLAAQVGEASWSKVVFLYLACAVKGVWHKRHDDHVVDWGEDDVMIDYYYYYLLKELGSREHTSFENKSKIWIVCFFCV